MKTKNNAKNEVQRLVTKDIIYNSKAHIELGKDMAKTLNYIVKKHLSFHCIHKKNHTFSQEKASLKNSNQ